jgi:succinate dehydrogenase / fumarate reductase iron-sulfur subunit
MGQIMRLRRIAGSDLDIADPNNGHRHEEAFTTLIRDYGLLHEAELLPRSYGGDSWFGKFHPAAGKELLSSLPIVLKGLMRRKVNPKTAVLGHRLPKPSLRAVRAIYEKIEGKGRARGEQRAERHELNLFVTGYDEDEQPAPEAAAAARAEHNGAAAAGSEAAQGSAERDEEPE